MCRLFAFVAPHVSGVDRELGKSGIDNLKSLARAHGDGWGWSGVPDDGVRPIVHKSARQASIDSEFETVLGGDSRAAIVHLRMATLGLDVETDNTHPFLADGISFAHNGSLSPIGRIRDLLSPASQAGMQGETDSEMYFALIRERVAAGQTLASATWNVVKTLQETFPGCSLNAVLLSVDELIVVHANAGSVLGADKILGFEKFQLPNDHADDYYGLRGTIKPDGTIVIGSTGVAEADWAPLPAESVITIRLADAVTSVAPLAADPGLEPREHEWRAFAADAGVHA